MAHILTSQEKNEKKTYPRKLNQFSLILVIDRIFKSQSNPFHLRSAVAGGVASGDYAAVGVVDLIEPHLDAVIEDVAHVGQVAGVCLPGQVLSGVLEGVGVVAAVVHHVALADVEGGQVGKLVIPLHGGHATGGIMVGIVSASDVVALVIVRVDKDPLVIVVDVDQLRVSGAGAVPPVAVPAGDVASTVADVPRAVVGGLGHSQDHHHQDCEQSELHGAFDFRRLLWSFSVDGELIWLFEWPLIT